MEILSLREMNEKKLAVQSSTLDTIHYSTL